MPGEDANRNRGDTWVIAQSVLFAAFVFSLALAGDDSWQRRRTAFVVGIIVACFGKALCLIAFVTLGRSLTIFPRPRKGGKLVRHGVYSVVRHPIYLGAALVLIGWSVAVRSWISAVLATTLIVLFAAKSTVEETHLMERFPEYGEYRRRTWRILPWVY